MILLSIVELFKGEGQRQWEACLPHGEGGEVGENCAENSHLCLNAVHKTKPRCCPKYNYILQNPSRFLKPLPTVYTAYASSKL